MISEKDNELVIDNDLLLSDADNMISLACSDDLNCIAGVDQNGVLKVWTGDIAGVERVQTFHLESDDVMYGSGQVSRYSRRSGDRCREPRPNRSDCVAKGFIKGVRTCSQLAGSCWRWSAVDRIEFGANSRQARLLYFRLTAVSTRPERA